RAMPAAPATSSTLTSLKPRPANRSMATSVICSRVVERRRPTRGCGGDPVPGIFSRPLPFWHSMPYPDPECERCDSALSNLTAIKGGPMDNYQQTEAATDTELVVENLVEEVSIDGMCGVY